MDSPEIPGVSLSWLQTSAKPPYLDGPENSYCFGIRSSPDRAAIVEPSHLCMTSLPFHLIFKNSSTFTQQTISPCTNNRDFTSSRWCCSLFRAEIALFFVDIWKPGRSSHFISSTLSRVLSATWLQEMKNRRHCLRETMGHLQLQKKRIPKLGRRHFLVS